MCVRCSELPSDISTMGSEEEGIDTNYIYLYTYIIYKGVPGIGHQKFHV